MSRSPWNFVAVLLCWAVAAAAQTGDAVESRFMDALEQGRFAEAHAMFAPNVAAALGREQLQATWEGLARQLGEYRGRGPARSETVAGTPVTAFRLEFAGAPLDALIGTDADDRINGFRLVPAAPPSATAPEPATDRKEIAVEVAGALPGLLTLPAGDGPFPAVVLVHGSGPNDRDQTIGGNRPFLDLAHGLAARGVASLRYDKRTRVRPEGFVGTAYTVREEVLDDAVAAAALLRERAEIDPDRIVIVGHSLGGLLAPRIGARVEPAPAGLVLLAAPARRLQALVVEQVEYIAGLDGAIDGAEAAQIEMLRTQAAAADAAEDLDSVAAGMLGLPESYFADLNAYDAVATAAALALPMLIAQGGRDYQVTMDGDFARWREAFAGNDAVRLLAYDDLDHLFRVGEGMATPASYLGRSGPFDARVIGAIADFIEDIR